MSTDLRDALRALRAGRGTTIAAFVVLTAAMAAATVTFSVVDAVALRPLPYRDPGRLVTFVFRGQSPGSIIPASPSDYFDILDGARSLEAVGATHVNAPLSLEVNGVPELFKTTRVTANLFDVLGITPATGRFFGPEFERPDGPSAVILSYELWVHKFARDPAVVGRQLNFADGQRAVVGVLPEGTGYPISSDGTPDLYIPYVSTAAERADVRGLSVSIVARLVRGVTLEKARVDVQRVSSAIMLSLKERIVGPARSSLVLVLAAVGVVLLVAFVNVASLLLALAASRTAEFATREALGASRRRLAAGLLLEGLLLALSSAAVALVLSIWGIEFAKANLPAGLTRVWTIAINGRVLGAAIAIALGSAVIFAGAPAWLAGRSDLVSLMRTGGGALVGSRWRNRALSGCLIADVAFVSVLLVMTSLVVTTFIVVATRELGFDRHDLLSLSYRSSLKDVPERDQTSTSITLRTALIDRVKSTAGVSDAAIVTTTPVPLSGTNVHYGLTIPGYGDLKRDEMLSTSIVTPGYFGVMGIERVRGRLFNATDIAGAPGVLIINDIAAARFFRGRDPIGQQIDFFGTRTIVGITRAVRFNGPETNLEPEMFAVADQVEYANNNRMGMLGGSLVVRLSRNRPAAISDLIDATRAIVGGTEPVRVNRVDDYFHRLTLTRRFNALLIGIFGLIAVAIGAIGVYGTMAFFISQKVRDIGLRMALGATPLQVMRSVLGNALLRVALGIAIGLAGAWTISGAFTSFVFGIRPTEPAIYASVAGLLTLIGFVAALRPALRAARVDPVAALRQD